MQFRTLAVLTGAVLLSACNSSSDSCNTSTDRSECTVGIEAPVPMVSKDRFKVVSTKAQPTLRREGTSQDEIPIEVRFTEAASPVAATQKSLSTTASSGGGTDKSPPREVSSNVQVHNETSPYVSEEPPSSSKSAEKVTDTDSDVALATASDADETVRSHAGMNYRTLFRLVYGYSAPDDPNASMPWEVENDDATLGDTAQEEVYHLTVKKGDSLFKILGKIGLETGFYYSLDNGQQSSLSSFSVGDDLTIKGSDGVMTYFSRQLSPLKTLVMEKKGDDYEVRDEVTDPEMEKRTYAFSMSNSLFHDGAKAGLSNLTLGHIKNILTEKVSFKSGVQKGDKVSVVLNVPTFNGKQVGEAKVLGVKYKSGSQDPIYALLFSDNGRERYYDINGSSLETGFIRFPTNYTRISSNFSRGRKHPVLGYVRPHLGTDLAAPKGSPIYAASDGVVSRAGVASGYGRVVYIDHKNGIQTRYAHMSKINTRRGEKVSRGDVIGYVGMSGTATGYHLHFEYRVNGKAMDAMKVDLPQAKPIKTSNLEAFRSRSAPIVRMLDGRRTKEL